MGPIRAVVRCYVNIVNFSGRARRAEYWWFFVFAILANIGLQIGTFASLAGGMGIVRALSDPAYLQNLAKQDDAVSAAGLIAGLVWLCLLWLPQMSVTVRRLHDTNRSGWLVFVPMLAGMASVAVGVFAFFAAFAGGPTPLLMLVLLVPLGVNIWFLVVLCLPGTHGANRFGPDPVVGRKRRADDHPAFATPADPEERRILEAARRAEISDYYRKNVLNNGSRA